MTEMSKQEAFDRALRGVRAQDGFAMRGSNCIYYDEGTERRCGVGHCFTRAQAMDLQDELDVLGQRAASAIGEEVPAEAAKEAGLPDTHFLRQLQLAHDNASRHGLQSMPEFEDRMRELAKNYGLEYTAP